MREVRIYQEGSYTNGETLTLSAQAAHHVAVVLRMQTGDSLCLFDGNNNEFSAIIKAISKKTVQVHLVTHHIINRESPLSIHLAQVISKGERMEMVVQKAIELGVAAITPLTSERCVVKLADDRLQKKIAQWQAIAVAACEQSGRNVIPLIHPAQTLHNFAEKEHPGQRLVLSPDGSSNLRQTITPDTQNITLVIGPEGGLSNAEINHLKQNQFNAVTLGPRILRTETAAIATISVLQALRGDL